MRNICMAPFFGVFLVGAPLALADRFAPNVANSIWDSSLFSVFWFLLWVGAIIGFVAAFFVGLQLNAAKCPRCGEAFHSGPSERWGFVSNGYTRKCINCGLQLNGGNSLGPA
jgi:hypothetical protein